MLKVAAAKYLIMPRDCFPAPSDVLLTYLISVKRGSLELQEV